ncbi:uncharacterized protein F4807DRAFT_463097 [Annulohypoxylon truncatum]|uniref:uncharacterized protein n=1 Tax=Annulohypoxylon truncatum TaxID=327061 RepID=UPI002008D267|nr:uncharacterized protein F4807DRAFT_463097 [Annulohypoxylon truncatum]KAI1207034.1 hypothetical protein F4807DRAFT_463097 [Annulohypoxylon truncatum]
MSTTVIMPPVSRVIYTVPPPAPPPLFIDARDAPGPPNRPLPRPPTRPRPRPQPPVPRPETGASVVLQPATLWKPATFLRPVASASASAGNVVSVLDGQLLVPVVNVPLNSASAPDALLLRRVT